MFELGVFHWRVVGNHSLAQRQPVDMVAVVYGMMTAVRDKHRALEETFYSRTAAAI